MNDSKRILIVTPVFPMPERGADQYERAGNIRQFVALGYDVTVITKIAAHVDPAYVQACAKELGIRIISIPYRYGNTKRSTSRRLLDMLGRFRNLRYFDGAAYEYSEPLIQEALEHELQTKPGLVWFDYTYLWPLYDKVRRRNIPIVTRSINFEPMHFLEEEGRSFVNYLKYIPKLWSERQVVKKSDIIVVLSPYEADVYRRLGARTVRVVPLRGLPRVLRNRHSIRTQKPLHVFFMGSTYTVGHNERALDFVTGHLADRVRRECPNEFIFHISGAKVPKKYESRFDGTSVICEGYLDLGSFDEYLDRMDIAISPSNKEVGMQQKVYEPLCRGIPLITNPVNMGGYPFENGLQYLAARTPDEYFEQLLVLRDPRLRQSLSEHALATTKEFFSAIAIDRALQEVLASRMLR